MCLDDRGGGVYHARGAGFVGRAVKDIYHVFDISHA